MNTTGQTTKIGC